MDQPLTIKIDEVSFQLKKPHPLEWLSAWGKVFAVFDKQDSGNLSFGVEKDGVRRFIKYAGAATTEFEGEPAEAILRLKQAVQVYEDLDHPSLVRLLSHFEAGPGYAAVFEWFDGESLHPHWAFPPPAKYEDPRSPFYRYRRLPLEKRLASYRAILDFHVHVEEKGYIAVDFYDGSVLYDFAADTTKICDIDLYQKAPFENRMGRLWGSSRFMSPEEFEYGAAIDGVTNVYNMGATAFFIFGGELDRSYDQWDAGRSLYDIALKAVHAERAGRYASVADFASAWDKALLEPDGR